MTKSGNPYHVPAGSPKGGQFTFAPGTQMEFPGMEVGDAARKAAGLDTHSEQRIKAYKDFHEWTLDEAEYRGDKYLAVEMASLINKDGSIEAEEVGEGTFDTVEFSDDEIARMPGKYLIHNHSNDMSFSSADIDFAGRNDLGGIIVTGPSGVHIVDFLHPEDASLSRNATSLSSELEQIRWRLFEEYNNALHTQTQSDAMAWLKKGPMAQIHSLESMEILDSDPDWTDFFDFQFIPWGDL